MSETITFRLGYGILADPIAEQLATQGLMVEHADKYEKQRLAINVLRIADLLTESEAHKATTRLHKNITKEVKVIEAK